MALKNKLADAGPEVVAKLVEEKKITASRLSLANRKALELESTVADIKIQLDRAMADNKQVGPNASCIA